MLRTHRQRLLLLTLLCAASPAGAASASASPITLTHHDVVVEGEYAYAIASDHVEKGFRRTSDLVAKGRLASSVARLTFAYDAEGQPQDATERRADYALRVASSGSFLERETSEFGSPHERRCAIGEEEGSPAASGYIERSLVQPLTGTDVAMDLRLVEALPIPFEASAGCNALGPIVGSGEAIGAGRFDASFFLPREAVTAGKTIQLVSGPTHERCPGFEQPDVTTCSLTWKAKITLVKTGEEIIGADEPGTPTTPAPAPTPTVPTPDPARGQQAMIDAVSRALREQRAAEQASEGAMVDAVSRAIREHLQQATPAVSSERARLDVRCPGTCTGTLSATAVATRTATRGTALGRTPFRAGASPRAATAPTSRLRATLRFSAADRRALRRARFVVLTARVTPAGTRTPVVVRRVVRAPR